MRRPHKMTSDYRVWKIKSFCKHILKWDKTLLKSVLLQDFLKSYLLEIFLLISWAYNLKKWVRYICFKTGGIHLFTRTWSFWQYNSRTDGKQDIHVKTAKHTSMHINQSSKKRQEFVVPRESTSLNFENSQILLSEKLQIFFVFYFKTNRF